MKEPLHVCLWCVREIAGGKELECVCANASIFPPWDEGV